MAQHLEQVAEGMDRGALEGACLEAQRLQRLYGLSEQAFAEIGFNAELAADRIMEHASFPTASDRRTMADACRQLVACTYHSLREHPDLLQEVLPHLHAAMFEEVRRVRQDTGVIREEQKRAAAALEWLVEAASAEQPSVPLPMPAMPDLVGRDHELGELVRLLTSPDVVAPVLLRGGPGVGKSALSLAAAHDPTVAARYPRRLFVRLLPVKSGAGIIDAVAVELGLEQGTDRPARALRALAKTPTLLVLDNLETPWDADSARTDEALSRLVAIPGLRLIGSLRGTVTPGALRWRTADLGPLTRPDARKLFLKEAFEASEDPALDDLLAALGGVPLAIVLIARRHRDGDGSAADLLAEWRKRRTEVALHGTPDDRRPISPPRSSFPSTALASSPNTTRAAACSASWVACPTASPSPTATRF